MFTEKDIVRKEIRKGVRGQIYLCKGCGKEFFKSTYYSKKCTGYCITCSPRNMFKKEPDNSIIKKCVSCNRELDINNFSLRANKHYKNSCTLCVNLKTIFKISFDDYNKILIKQNNVCGICKLPEKSILYGKIKNLSVDHCHTTGKIRGLLCNKCNTGLGLFKDNLNNLENAINYLKENT